MWEVRKIHDSIEALLQDLSPRTGRSILHELSDNELSSLLHHIRSKLTTTGPIAEKDRWTIWTAIKRQGSLTLYREASLSHNLTLQHSWYPPLLACALPHFEHTRNLDLLVNKLPL